MAYPTSVLNTNVPFRGAPVYLRNVKSLSRAKDYAAAAFHVCAIRGLAGGCADPASGTRGTKGTGSDYICDAPLGRESAKTAWAQAGGAYLDVYNGLAGGLGLTAAREALAAANMAADTAYAAEGVEPPRDPQTGIAETALDKLGDKGPSTAGFPWWVLIPAGALLLFKGSKGKGKRRRGGRRTRVTRRRRSRRR